jgi:hypothetical protein
MLIQKTTREVLEQLVLSVSALSEADYVKSCPSLMNHSIGQHVRHIIELYQCLENGYCSGLVDYDSRKRDEEIETDKRLAISLLKIIADQIDKLNKELVLNSDFGSDEMTVPISTNYFRELAYNLEHMIHHMALIRIGIREVSKLELPAEYGVAPSTLKHRKQCVQ